MVSVESKLIPRKDAHVTFDGFGGEPTTGYFAVYDGHGGRGAVEFVRDNLHKVSPLLSSPEFPFWKLTPTTRTCWLASKAMLAMSPRPL